jgi:hypothetical protein
MNYGADELDGSGMTRQLRTSICGMYSCSCPSRVSGSIHGLVVSLIMLIEGAPSFAMFRYSRNCAGCVREHVTPHPQKEELEPCKSSPHSRHASPISDSYFFIRLQKDISALLRPKLLEPIIQSRVPRFPLQLVCSPERFHWGGSAVDCRPFGSPK